MTTQRREKQGKTTAAQACKARTATIKAQLGRIDEQLGKHAKRAAARPTDWGFAGDLEHVAQLLRQVEDFFGYRT